MEGRAMTLLLIFRKIWRYKLATIPIFALVLAGSFYVIAVTAPTYETSATYILVNPPPLPTEAEIARNPELGRINGDNPYARFSDTSVLVQILASRMNSDDKRLALEKQGADINYQVAPSVEFGFSAPLVQVTGTGTTAEAAVKTATVVGQALTQELDQMQSIRKVDKTYRIKAEAVVAVGEAKLKPSGKLRSLVAVMVLGTIMLFIAISVLDAISALRSEWAQRGGNIEHRPGATPATEPPVPLRREPAPRRGGVLGGTPPTPPPPDTDSDARPWTLEARR
jgi:hypothetical protein